MAAVLGRSSGAGPQVTTAEKRSARLALSPKVRALQDRVNKRMATLADQTIESLYPALRRVRDELASNLRQWLADHPIGGEEAWTAQKYRSLMVQLDTAIDAARDLGPVMDKALAVGGNATARAAARALEQRVELFSKTFGEPLLLDLDTAAVLAGPRKLLLERIAEKKGNFGAEAEADIRDRFRPVRRLLLDGTLKSETFHQMATRVAAMSPYDGANMSPTADGMAAGTWRTSMYRAERVVRTEMMAVANETHLEGLRQWEQSDADAMQMQDESDDSRTCIRCRRLDGRIGKIGSFDPPPVHQQCRGVLVPWHRSWEHTSREDRTYGAGR